MNSRDSILAAIRSAGVPPAPAASAMSAFVDDGGLVERFVRVLADVGGKGILSNAQQSLEDALADIGQSLGISRADLLVVNGRFGVAENAAVYLDSADLTERASIVRAEHVALVISGDTLVPTMHEAMRLMPRDSRCGWFLSGPSKTADIEQSLVIGAQGARTLHVILKTG